MKKQQYRQLSSVLALLSISAVAIISLLTFAGLAKPGWLSLLSVLLSMLAIVFGYSAMKDMKGLLTSLRMISREAGVISETMVDLASLVEATSQHAHLEAMQGLDALFGVVNDDVASLQRSATKFDLFSSDILFSAQNLSDQASRQSDMLVSLRERTGGFFEVLTKTNDELGVLGSAINRNAESAASLEQRARVSKDELNGIIENSVTAAKEAKHGEAEVANTSRAAEELEEG